MIDNFLSKYLINLIECVQNVYSFVSSKKYTAKKYWLRRMQKKYKNVKSQCSLLYLSQYAAIVGNVVRFKFTRNATLYVLYMLTYRTNRNFMILWRNVISQHSVLLRSFVYYIEAFLLKYIFKTSNDRIISEQHGKTNFMLLNVALLTTTSFFLRHYNFNCNQECTSPLWLQSCNYNCVQIFVYRVYCIYFPEQLSYRI